MILSDSKTSNVYGQGPNREAAIADAIENAHYWDTDTESWKQPTAEWIAEAISSGMLEWSDTEA